MVATVAATFSIASVGYNAAGGIGQPLANIVKALVETIADNCPDAFIHIINNPINFTVPIAVEILKIKLGKNRVEAVISSDVQGLTEYEANALEALKPELKSSIEKGVAFAQKQAAPTSV
ncbi:hypothetical protein IFM89_029260 [Coptis chinensis]|uniref:malate dehydrogenase n=1 Tax=Coptis chinensis TaxID=261450 RepID=A0A835LEW6_9MAGN|nr:hypothetical protein IFM89_029260 [Coptis chinensis]